MKVDVKTGEKAGGHAPVDNRGELMFYLPNICSFYTFRLSGREDKGWLMNRRLLNIGKCGHSYCFREDVTHFFALYRGRGASCQRGAGVRHGGRVFDGLIFPGTVPQAGGWQPFRLRHEHE